MERNTIELIGEFKKMAFEGERMNVYIFQDYNFGNYSVGVHFRKNFHIECGVPIKAVVRVSGQSKMKPDGFVEYFTRCNLLNLEQVTQREGVKSWQQSDKS